MKNSCSGVCMSELTWKDHISIDGNICHGKACISGTRLLVSVLLDNLAENYSFEDIIQNYPGITREDILSCIKYASLLSHERTVALVS